MNRRERALATIVGLLLILVVGFMATTKIQGAFRKKESLLAQAKDDLNKKQQVIDLGARSAKALAEYEEISLPSKVELARSQYQAWLSEIAGKAGIKELEVKVTGQSRRANGCTQLNCAVNGEGNLREVTNFLYEFYSVDTIHRIRRLPLRPVPDSKDLKINMRIEALILPTAAAEKQFNTSPTSELASLPVEKVLDPIIERNFFAPKNQPPEFGRLGKQTIERGTSFSLELTGSDPDKLDTISFELSDHAPDGLTVSSQGRLRWRPREVGNYVAKVILRDDGIPEHSVEKTIAISVVEPPPPPTPKIAETETPEVAESKFDAAKFTYAIAMIEVAGKRQLWLQVRTSGKIIKLGEGDPVKVGSMDAQIARIGERDVQLVANGKTISVKVGEPLVSME